MDEAEIILNINTIFSLEEREKYNDLYAKFQQDDLTQAEYKELLELSDKFELLNARRLEYISQLAQIRHQTLLQVMQDLEFRTEQL